MNYVFNCHDCGPFEVAMPMTSASEALNRQPCPDCAGSAGRDYRSQEIRVPTFWGISKDEYMHPDALSTSPYSAERKKHFGNTTPGPSRWGTGTVVRRISHGDSA